MNTITVKVETVFDNGMIVSYEGGGHVTYMGALIRQTKVVDPYRSAKVKNKKTGMSYDTPLAIVDSREIAEKLNSISELDNNLTNHLRSASTYCESLPSDVSITASLHSDSPPSPPAADNNVCVVMCDQPLSDIEVPFSNHSRRSKSKAYKKMKRTSKLWRYDDRNLVGDHRFSKRRKKRSSRSKTSTISSNKSKPRRDIKPIPPNPGLLPIKPFSLKLSKVIQIQ